MKFTWPDKFTRALERVPDELLPQLVRAVCAYGTDGIEPELEFPLDAMFELFREDIDYSRAARESGARGGKHRSADPSKGSENPCKGSPDPSKGSENPCKPIQDNTYQDNADIHEVELPEDEGIPFGEIVDALNEQAGTHFRASSEKTRSLIRARWREGFRLPDFQQVCRVKSAQWRGTDMERYLRPPTLFGTKFECYLNEEKGGGDDGFDEYD